jgi:hypothetical protein
MKIYSICTKKTYKKDGVEKTIWLNAGSLRETDDGKRFIELNHLPDVSFYVFEPKEKTAKPETKQDDWS